MDRQEQKNLITPQVADALISLRDGDMTLLYLYLCRTGRFDREQICLDLFWSKQRLNEAWERLEMSSLLPLPPPSIEKSTVTPTRVQGLRPQTDTELPDAYTSADVVRRADSDSAFQALISEAQLIMGRTLSSPDLIKLLGIYDHLDLPPEVIMELMNHVADIYREKYGEQKRPSARAFENEARAWVERGITDFDAAEQYIRVWRERKNMETPIKEALGISGRDFTDTERRYLRVWLDCGFGPDAIHLAYDKTVTNTRKFSAAYMNRILMNWHEKGLHTLSEIQEKDRPSVALAGRTVPTGTAADPQAIQDLIDQI